MADGPQIINPCNFTEEQGVLLRTLLEHGSANNKIQIWYPDVKYYIKRSFRGVVQKTEVSITHTIVHRSRINPVTHQPENRYSVFSETMPIDDGSYSKVCKILGTLSHARNNGMLFSSRKERVIKVGEFGDEDEAITSKSKKSSRQNIQREAEISAHVKHLHAKSVVFDDDRKKSYLPMKYLDGTKLSILIENLGSSRVSGDKNVSDVEYRLQLSYLLIEALYEQMHAANIIHRDIKPDNIKIEEKSLSVKILDMGLSRKADQPDGVSCGTDGFAAPEVFVGKDEFASDIYSMGIVLGLLWGGRFDRLQTKKTHHASPHYDVPKIIELFSDMQGVMPAQDKADIARMIDEMVSLNPEARPDAKSAMKAFDEILMRLRLAKVPESYRDSVSQAHDMALDMAQTLKSNAAKSFERVMSELKTCFNALSDNSYAINEFTQALHLKCFRGCNKKEVGLAKLESISKSYRLTSARLEEMRCQLAITIAAIRRTSGLNSSDMPVNNDSLRKALAERLEDMDMEVQLFQYKLHKHAADLDGLDTRLYDTNRSIEHMTRNLENQRLQLSDMRFSEKELKARLVQESAGSTMADIKNKIKEQISSYLDSSGVLNPAGYRFWQIPPRQRVRDMHEIIDIVDYASDYPSLRRHMLDKLAALGTGATGRSQLRDSIAPLFETSTRMINVYAS